MTGELPNIANIKHQVEGIRRNLNRIRHHVSSMEAQVVVTRANIIALESTHPKVLDAETKVAAMVGQINQILSLIQGAEEDLDYWMTW